MPVHCRYGSGFGAVGTGRGRSLSIGEDCYLSVKIVFGSRRVVDAFWRTMKACVFDLSPCLVLWEGVTATSNRNIMDHDLERFELDSVCIEPKISLDLSCSCSDLNALRIIPLD